MSPLESNVALLAEGVDRNMEEVLRCITEPVALLAEGVDRNTLKPEWKHSPEVSPSSRRAWIEML